MEGQDDVRYPDEPAAVMYALRHSRDMEKTATVYDPDGRMIVEFHKREYDIDLHTQLDYWRNDDMLAEIARSRIERKAGGTSTQEEAGGGKRVTKKGTDSKAKAKRTINRKR